MGKFLDDSLYDAALNVVKNNGSEMYLCSSQPADRAAAITASLATKTGLVAGDYTGPANGDTSGRKLTKNAESSISVIGDGNVTHVAICSGTTLLAVSEVTSQAVTTGNTVNTPAFDIEFLDVTP
jgi:hypothetical protein